MKHSIRRLWATDNLDGLAQLDAASIRLVYLDPPFNSKRNYDAIVASRHVGAGHRRPAFFDCWGWDETTERSFTALPRLIPRTAATFIQGLVQTIGRSDLSGYLVMMAPRLCEMHRVLANDGSLYLHCDPAASHYLKALLDHIFGPENFRNEIVWRRTHAHSSSRRFGPVHDVILFYSKTSKYLWNPCYSKYASSYIETHFTHADAHGRYQLITCTAPGDRTGTRAHYEWRGRYPPPGRHWAWTRERMEELDGEGRLAHSSTGVPRLKRYVGDGQGVLLQDTWTDIGRLDAHSDERVGFETQKPLALLRRIIEASSHPGDVVLDPFCGSGTTLVAAEMSGRQWIGIDTSLLACSISLARVRQVANVSAIRLTGFPESKNEALAVLRSDPVGFGIWATSMLATLPDRRAFNGSVATGTGSLKVAKKRLQILSWVPLRPEPLGVIPTLAKGQLSKIGLILRGGSGYHDLRAWLKNNMTIKLHDISLDGLVKAEARRQGLADGVLVATQTP